MIAPMYDEDGITIYCGDCREVLDSIDSVDITFSSPPYNILSPRRPSGMMAESNHKKLYGYDSIEDNLSEFEYTEFLQKVFGHCIAKSIGLCWINHKTRFVNRAGIHPLSIFPWEFEQEIVWNRNCSTMFNAKRFAVSHEFIYGFGKSHYWDDNANIQMTVWNIRPEYDIKSHPCPMPVELARRCIFASCPPGGIVLDPFMGSGTTLVAAKKEGRKAIGIDVSEAYCKLAIKRLQQKQFDFADDERRGVSGGSFNFEE